MKSVLTRALATAALAAAIVAPGAASAAIYNIDAVTSTGVTPVTVTLDPGTYRIEWVGVAGGGLYNGYNLNCPSGVCPASGWQNDFTSIQTGDPTLSLIGLFNMGGGGPQQFSSALAALDAYQNAPSIVQIDLDPPYGPGSVSGVDITPQPWIAHVGETTTLHLFISDPNNRDDNVGGVSLRIAAVPEPGVWAMMLAGFGGIGALLRRRRQSRGQSQDQSPAVA
jgi:hypothetical protein